MRAADPRAGSRGERRPEALENTSRHHSSTTYNTAASRRCCPFALHALIYNIAENLNRAKHCGSGGREAVSKRQNTHGRRLRGYVPAGCQIDAHNVCAVVELASTSELPMSSCSTFCLNDNKTNTFSVQITQIRDIVAVW